MPEELETIIEGSFDVVPAVKLLALRLQQLERDVFHLVAAEPVEDTKPRATSKQRASGKGGSG